MFKKILIAKPGDKAAGLAVKGDFAAAKSAATKLRSSRSELGD